MSVPGTPYLIHFPGIKCPQNFILQSVPLIVKGADQPADAACADIPEFLAGLPEPEKIIELRAPLNICRAVSVAYLKRTAPKG